MILVPVTYGWLGNRVDKMTGADCTRMYRRFGAGRMAAASVAGVASHTALLSPCSKFIGKSILPYAHPQFAPEFTQMLDSAKT